MSFTPVFRALSDRQVGMMSSLPFTVSRSTNINTLSSLRSRDMVKFKYTANGVVVVATSNGKKIVDAVKHLHQTDYFETRKDVGGLA